MIRVVIVDDSVTARLALSRALSSDPEITVLATFGDPARALSEIAALNPDLVTSDVDMPGMDGITFLRALSRIFPCPVVMVSALTTPGSRTTLDALEAGAADVVVKPKDLNTFQDFAEELPSRLKSVVRARAKPPSFDSSPTGLQRVKLRSLEARDDTRTRLVAIGGSTGAPQILPDLLSRLGATSVPVVVAIHMPGGFTRTYAERLQTMLPNVFVTEGRSGQAVGPGQVVIAPGEHHVRVALSGGTVRLLCEQTAPIQHHRPSIDLLFESCARQLGQACVGVLLTGMGQDGANGLLKMKGVGAVTLVQEPESCMVDGMPRAAIEGGGALEVLSPKRIALRIAQFVA